MNAADELQKKLEHILKPGRFRHTVGVRYTAQAMAMRFGENVEQIGVAGVLHDCAKYMTEDDMLAECKKYGIECTEVEKKQPHLLHAKLGACYAKEKYGITDGQVLSAIRWHTTGRPDMTDFEKII